MSEKTLNFSMKNDLESFSESILDTLKGDFGKDIYNSNPFEMISSLGNKYIIIRYPTKIDNISGLYYNLYDYKCIYINSNHLLCRQFFSCWHEFYHCTRNNQEIASMEEKEADYFASCMLLPREDVKSYIRNLKINYKNLREKDLIIMQNFFNVSLASLALRLNDIYDTKFFSPYIRYRDINLNDELMEKTKIIQKTNSEINMDLLLPTQDFATSKKVLDIIIYLIDNDKISLDKANVIYDFIHEKGVQFLW